MSKGVAMQDNSIDKLTKANKKLVAEHHRLNLRIEELEHELSLLTHSPSWRVTAPLRKIKPLIGSLFALFKRSKHVMSLNPFSDLVVKGSKCHISGSAPYFIMESLKKRLPLGWVEVELTNKTSGSHKSFAFYFDRGDGFSENDRIDVSFKKKQKALVKFPVLLKTLRADPLSYDAESVFTTPEFVIQELSPVKVFMELLGERLRQEKARSGGTTLFWRGLVSGFFQGGWQVAKHKVLLDKLSRADYNLAYQRWIKKYATLRAGDYRKIKKTITGFKNKPLISIVMPVYNTPEKWLRKAIDSVICQCYENWELCISDDASTRPTVREVLEEYKIRDSRIKVIYRETNEHISASSNSALSIAEGEYVALLDHDDELAPHALYHVVREINLHPELDLIFSDEDRITKDGKRLDPYFKMGWNKALLLSQNCVSHLGVYRTAIAKKVAFRKGFEGSQDWDFTLRFLEETNDKNICHIPHVLYHWRLVPGTVSFTSETKADAFDAGLRAVSDFCERNSIAFDISRDKRGFLTHSPKRSLAKKSVAAVIEYAGDAPLKRAINSLFESSAVHIGQVIVVGSKNASINSNAINELCKAYGISPAIIKGASLKDELINLVQTDYIAFIGREAEVLSADILNQLATGFVFSDVGATGGALYQPDGTVKSMGYTLNIDGGLVKSHFGLSADSPGYFGLACYPHYVPAISAECLLIKSELFKNLSSELITLTRGSIDLGAQISFALRKNNLKVMLIPPAKVRSYRVTSEYKLSLSSKPTDKQISLEEFELMTEQFHNPNLSFKTPDFFLAFPPENLEVL